MPNVGNFFGPGDPTLGADFEALFDCSGVDFLEVMQELLSKEVSSNYWTSLTV